MTYEEAVFARDNHLWVKARPKDGHAGWTQGTLSEVTRRTVTIRSRGALIDRDIEEVAADETRNTSERKPTIPRNLSCREDKKSHKWVIFDTKNWCGYADAGWSEDDAKWKRFEDEGVADQNRRRFVSNGSGDGVKTLRLEDAISRYYQHLEEETAPRDQRPVNIGALSDLSAGVPNFGLIGKGWAEAGSIAQDQQEDQKRQITERELIQRLDGEIRDRQRMIESANSRLRDISERMESRKIELAGVVAKLQAILQG